MNWSSCGNNRSSTALRNASFMVFGCGSHKVVGESFLFPSSVYKRVYLQKLKLNVMFEIGLESVQVTQYENTI